MFAASPARVLLQPFLLVPPPYCVLGLDLENDHHHDVQQQTGRRRASFLGLVLYQLRLAVEWTL
jgi:hypothetical protein